MRVLTRTYACVVAILLCWAWYIDVSLLNSSREHLLPDMVLAFAALPSSLTLEFAYRNWTDLFNRPLVQLGWLSFCALGQVAAAFGLARILESRRRDA